MVMGVLGLILVAVGLLACSSDRRAAELAAETTFETFLSDLTRGNYTATVDTMRAPNGGPLPERARTDLLTWWRSHLGPAGAIHIERLEYTGNRPLTPEVLRALKAQDGFQLMFDTVGSSDDPCFIVPTRNATARVARIDGRWFVIPADLTEYLFPCPAKTVVGGP